jgi:hypothetical protein
MLNQLNSKSEQRTERMPAKMMIEPLNICHTDASTYRRPIPAIKTTSKIFR